MNQIFITGRLGDSPTFRKLNAQEQVANMSIANTRIYVDKNGEERKETTWVKVTAWNALAEYAKFLQKGDMLMVTGRLKISEVSVTEQAKPNAQEVTIKKWYTEIIALSLRKIVTYNEFNDNTEAEQTY